MIDRLSRPKLKIKATALDKSIEIVAFILLLSCYVSLGINYSFLPDIVPIHFDSTGNPNGYSNKFSLWILPGIALLVNIFFTVLGRYPHVFNYPERITEENALFHYTLGTRLLRWLKVSINLVFLFITQMIVSGATANYSKFNVLFIPLVLLIVLAPIFYYLVRYRKAPEIK